MGRAKLRIKGAHTVVDLRDSLEALLGESERYAEGRVEVKVTSSILVKHLKSNGPRILKGQGPKSVGPMSECLSLCWV